MECQPPHTTQQSGRNAKPRIPPNTALKLSATSLQDRLAYVIIIAKTMEFHRLWS